MKTKLLFLLALPFLFYGCNKDSFTTKPKISIKSISKTVLSPGDLIIFELDFTDAEGDIQDTFYVQRISKICPGTVNFFSRNRVPEFSPTKNLKGIIEMGFGYDVSSSYASIRGCGSRNDTSYFRFWLKDKANNISDTVVSENIVFLK